LFCMLIKCCYGSKSSLLATAITVVMLCVVLCVCYVFKEPIKRFPNTNVILLSCYLFVCLCYVFYAFVRFSLLSNFAVAETCYSYNYLCIQQSTLRFYPETPLVLPNDRAINGDYRWSRDSASGPCVWPYARGNSRSCPVEK